MHQQRRSSDLALSAECRQCERLKHMLEEKTSELIELRRSHDVLLKQLHEVKTKQPSCGISQSSSLVTRASQSCDCLKNAFPETEILRKEVTDLRNTKKQLEATVNILTLEKQDLKDSNRRLLRTTSDNSMADGCAKHTEQLDEYKMLLHQAEGLAKTRGDKITDLQQQLQRLEEEIVALNHQLQVYRGDFEVERTAREEEHSKVEQLREQVDQLLSQQLPASDLQLAAGAKLGGSVAPQAQKRLSAVSPTATFPPSPRQQPTHQPPVQQHRAPLQTQPSRTDSLSCPVCNMEVPDHDSLNVHVNECIDLHGST